MSAAPTELPLPREQLTSWLRPERAAVFPRRAAAVRDTAAHFACTSLAALTPGAVATFREFTAVLDGPPEELPPQVVRVAALDMGKFELKVERLEDGAELFFGIFQLGPGHFAWRPLAPVPARPDTLGAAPDCHPLTHLELPALGAHVSRLYVPAGPEVGALTRPWPAAQPTPLHGIPPRLL